jgi:hypothetical protein
MRLRERTVEAGRVTWRTDVSAVLGIGVRRIVGDALVLSPELRFTGADSKGSVQLQIGVAVRID